LNIFEPILTKTPRVYVIFKNNTYNYHFNWLRSLAWLSARLIHWRNGNGPNVSERHREAPRSNAHYVKRDEKKVAAEPCFL